MKTQILRSTLLFILFLAGFFYHAQAQIVYTDLVPDVTISVGPTGTLSYNLDLNNDGASDYIITAGIGNGSGLCQNLTYGWIGIEGLDSNEYLLGGFSFGTLISSGSTGWRNQSSTLLSAYYQYSNMQCNWNTTGYWFNNSYLRIRLKNGSHYKYGWVLLNMNRGPFTSHFTVYEYAYNSADDHSILAGDTVNISSGILTKPANSEIKIFPNPVADKLIISFQNLKPNVEITITDISGNICRSIKANDTEWIELTTSEFVNGIYFVRIKMDDSFIIKKIFVNN